MTKKFLTLEEAFALPIDDSPFDTFEYNALDFTVYLHYDIRIDRLEFTLIIRHPDFPMKYRHDVEMYISREDMKSNPPTKFPEHLKEDVWLNVIWDLVSAYSLMHGANTNSFRWLHYPKDVHKQEYFKDNEDWPIITKESVAEYYKRNEMTPYLDFDGNPERK